MTNGNGSAPGLSARQALGLVLVVMGLGLVTDPEPSVDPFLAAVLLIATGLLLLGIDLFAGIATARRRPDREEDHR